MPTPRSPSPQVPRRAHVRADRERRAGSEAGTEGRRAGRADTREETRQESEGKVMEHTQAIAVRVRQLQGAPVDPQELSEALAVIQNTKTHTKHSRTKGTRGGRPEDAARLSAKVAEAPPNNPWGLTEAQCRVVSKHADGQSQTEIAAELGVARKTINTHMERSKEKMDALTATHAAVLWDRFAREQKA